MIIFCWRCSRISLYAKRQFPKDGVRGVGLHLLYSGMKIFELCHEKTNVLVSDLVRHKPGCTATEDGWRLEISDLGSRGIVLSV